MNTKAFLGWGKDYDEADLAKAMGGSWAVFCYREFHAARLEEEGRRWVKNKYRVSTLTHLHRLSPALRAIVLRHPRRSVGAVKIPKAHWREWFDFLIYYGPGRFPSHGKMPCRNRK